jgi:signal transduction histidine kinase/ActR/RegA family two-component response regulator
LRLAVVSTFETGRTNRHIEAHLHLARDGVRREIQVSASTALVRLQDQPKVLVCLEDITGRKQLEAQLLQAQKMDAIGQLAGGIAHDFNNILAATLLHLQLLRQNQSLGSEMSASLAELEQGTQRAADLTRQLLLFSRRQVMQTKRIDFNELISAMMNMLGRLLGEHIQTTFDRSPQPVWLDADPGMIEQTVLNLCINARDAMPRGGRLKLGVRRLILKIEDLGQRAHARPGLFACFAATDTGCGMDEATFKRMFEPFFTTKPLGKGTGLGLATVHGIAAQHHGWVEAESAVGQGTTFRVFLPAVEAPAPPPIDSGPAKSPGGTETILLVEDDDQMRRMVRLTLARRGYLILEATNGAEAIQVWERQASKVDLLLTDMVMPGGLSGAELAARLRLAKPDLKVLISSGYAADLSQQEGGLPDGISFLAKPYDPSALVKTVRECLDQK